MSIAFQRFVTKSIPMFILIYSTLFEQADKRRAFPSTPVDYSLPQIKEYDFIIVGAGCAGSVLANKLSRKFQVLLLERGGDPIPVLYVPNSSNFVASGTPRNPAVPVLYNWTSTKQVANLENDGFFNMEQGKVLGGGHMVNSGVYNRGSPKDFDNWAMITKDDSWSYEGVRRFFKLSENFWDEKNKNGELGVDGPISISEDKGEFKQVYNAYIAAAKELGYSTFENANGPQTPGFGKHSRTMKFGRKDTVYNAFLEPILTRKSLDIVRYADVTKVDIDDRNRAVGVYYYRHGVASYAKAKLEVILSAGALSSPVILMKSGVGQAEQLKAAGIPVKNDLPVGQNLQTHCVSYMCGKFTSEEKNPLKYFGPKDVQQFLKAGTGFLAAGNGISLGFVVSEVAAAQDAKNWPDIRFDFRISCPLYTPNADDTEICINVQVARPRSVGSITLDTKNPQNPGIWNPRFLTDDTDVKVQVEGMKIAWKLFQTKALQSFGVTPRTPPSTCQGSEFGSDSYWECFARRVTTSTYHVVGTCKMGRIDDPTAVVDTKLQVKGIRGLRVVDNSIQPVTTNADSMAPAIMIGQKGAHMILSKYRGLVQ